MSKKKVLFVNSTSTVCGIYQWGTIVYNEIQKSTKYKAFYAEPKTQNELNVLIKQFNISYVIINYFPGLFSWLNVPLIKGQNLKIKKVVGVFHEPTQDRINRDILREFDLIFCPDATLIYNAKYKEIPRIVFNNLSLNKKEPSDTFIVSTIGFPIPSKNLHKILEAVNIEFEQKVLIKMNLPILPIIKQVCEEVILKLKQYPLKPNIELKITSNFITTEELIQFLASSDITCFFYDVLQSNRGSSSIDLALSARVPIAVTNFPAFAPFTDVVPNIIYDQKLNSLTDIYNRGIHILEPLYKKWTPEIFIDRVENLLLKDETTPNMY